MVSLLYRLFPFLFFPEENRHYFVLFELDFLLHLMALQHFNIICSFGNDVLRRHDLYVLFLLDLVMGFSYLQTFITRLVVSVNSKAIFLS